jgi:hypothetical protein
MSALPPLLKSGALCQLLGVSSGTLWRWSVEDPTFRACVQVRSRRAIRWSTQKLIDQGILLRPTAEKAVSP